MQAIKTIWDDASQTYKQAPEKLENLPSIYRSGLNRPDPYGGRTKGEVQALNSFGGLGNKSGGRLGNNPGQFFDWARASPFYNKPSDEIYRRPTYQSQNQSDNQSYGDPFAQQLQSVKSDQTPQTMSPQVIEPAQTGDTATAEAPMSNLPLKSMNRARKVNPYWAYQMR